MNRLNRTAMSVVLPKSSQGFTLIELMIVVLRVAVIAAVALPSYSEYIIRANRAEGADRITEVMFEQERFQTRNRRYTDDLSVLCYDVEEDLPSDEGRYTISAGVCADGSDISDCVLVTATPNPNGSQQNDGVLSLDTRGNRIGPWENN